MTIYDRWKVEEDSFSDLENNDEELDDQEELPKETPKQNMSLDGFTTTKDLDLQLETILKSIEPDVLATIKNINKNK